MKEGWVYKKFEKCLVKVPKQKAVKTKQYLDEGLFPIVSQESSIISGYTNDEGLLYKHDKPIVIFGDHTKNIKYIDFDFVVGADGVHILLTKDDILPKFFFYELCSIKLRNLGYARHYKLLKEKNITYPSLAEQQQIVSFLDSEFEKIDALKANAETQLQAAKDLFQKALKEMLTPKEGWEEKKFDTIFDTVTDFVAAGSFADLRKNVVYNDSPDYAQLVRTTDLKNQFRNGGFVYVSQSAYNYLWRVKLNEECIVLPNVGVNCGEVYFINPKSLPYSNNVLGPNAILVRSSLFDNHFLSLLLQGQEAQYKLKGITSTMAQPKYNKTNLKTLYLHIPSNTEQQQRIAAHLDALSAKVKQLQENCNETITLCNDLKQSLLKKIFE